MATITINTKRTMIYNKNDDDDDDDDDDAGDDDDDEHLAIYPACTQRRPFAMPLRCSGRRRCHRIVTGARSSSPEPVSALHGCTKPTTTNRH